MYRPRALRSVFSPNVNRFITVTAVLIMLTSSFDIFLVLEAGGNYRFCQMLAPLLLGLAMWKATRQGKIPTLGLAPLSLWFLVQAVFIPVTDFWPKSLGYCLWLLLNVGLVFSFTQLFGEDGARLRTMLRWYAASFAVVAVFGIVQFLMPLLGLPALLVAQWWIPDVLPRANGFSYEPSYFATYLLIGFVFAGSLRRARSGLLRPSQLLVIQSLTAIGIVVSSSRMGIVFLLLELILTSIAPWAAFLRDFTRLRIVPAKARPLLPSLLSMILAAGVVGNAALALENNPALALIFLNGTGVSDTAAHSVIQRDTAFEDTLAVFAEHPVIGRSLGGVSSAIADLHGESIHSFEASKAFEGMNIFAEVLAASGCIGAIPFVWFLVEMIRKPLKLASVATSFHASNLRALVRSLLFALLILQFNQNLLRPYLWVHIAVLAATYAATRHAGASGATAKKPA